MGIVCVCVCVCVCIYMCMCAGGGERSVLDGCHGVVPSGRGLRALLVEPSPSLLVGSQSHLIEISSQGGRIL